VHLAKPKEEESMVKRYCLSLLACAMVMSFPMAQGRAASAGEPQGSGADRLSRIEHIVVIFEENHSFDNLYGSWEGVDGLAAAPRPRTIQVNQQGIPFTCLKQNDVNLTSPPLPALCSDATGVPFTSHFFNEPFTIDDFIPPTATTCPNGLPNGTPGGCTKDLVHRFYQERYQLNDGQQNRYVTGSDSIGLTMGVYRTSDLPIYRFLHRDGHPHYAIGDRFFQSATGGSFLNHQWLIAAATPVWPNAVNDGSANDLHSVVDANGMPVNYPFYASPTPALVMDLQLTASCAPGPGRGPTPPGVVCGDYAVNTIQPFVQPFSLSPSAPRLPLQTAPTIGDRLSAANVDWAWYSGGWSNANGDVNGPGWTNGAGPACSDPNALKNAAYPNCPDKLFQFHHQPFNFYAAYAPDMPARAAHLRDEEEFLQLAHASSEVCQLKPVSFIKPVGAENEHPGYASESLGSDHMIELLEAIQSGRCAKDTLVIVTYDEFGGQWDHVTPPGQGGAPGAHDIWGPGSRIPLLVISPFLRGDFVVDHTQYDTTSILATIERRFGLAPLTSRDAAVNDLSHVYDATSPFDDPER
jgi:acid phosphatase